MPEPAAPPTRTSRFELLDCFRAVAILAVVLLHFLERGAGSGDTRLHAPLWAVFRHGYLGVQLFFVVSGYCIVAAMHASAPQSRPFAHFWSRRLRRIFPPYWAGVLLVVGSGLLTWKLLGTPLSTVFPLRPWEWIANLFLLQGPLGATDASMVYWSLSIEIQFYAVISVCLLFPPRLRPAWMLLLAAFSLVVHATRPFPTTGWILAYWPEFACGIAAYYFITHSGPALLPALLVLAAILEMALSILNQPSLLQESGKVIPGLRIAFCLVTMVVMVLLHPRDHALSRTGWARLLAPVGVISYSLYLTHLPVGSRVFNLGHRLLGETGLVWIPLLLGALLLSAVAGIVFHRWCERPWLNSARPATRP